MRNRIVTLFLVLSIITSLFAVSAVSYSAAENKASLLPSPVNVSVDTSDNTVVLRWNEVVGASYYELFYMKYGTDWQSVKVEGTEHTFTEVNPHHTYFFQLRAFDKNDNPGYFTSVYKRYPESMLPAPSNFAASAVDNSVEVTWDEVNGAVKYELFYLRSDSRWQSVYVQDTNYTFTDISPYYSYYFQIRAVDEYDTPGYYSAVREIPLTALFPAPRNITLTTVGNSVKVDWDDVTDANRYELFYQQAGTGWNKVIANESSYTFSNINPRYTYYFQLRAIPDNIRQAGYFSAVQTRLAMPVMGVLKNYKGFINVNWSSVPGAVHYYLWYKTSLSNKWYCAPKATTNTYWNVTNPKAGTVFEFKVHAVFPNNSYSISDIKDITCLASPVYGINYSKNDKFNIHWDAVSGATKYEVVRFYNKKSQKVYSGSNTSFEDNETSNIGPYYYQVRALNNNSEGVWSAAVPVHYVPKNQRQQKIVELAHMEKGNGGEKYWKAMWQPDEWCAMYAGWLLRETRANLKENGWSINVGIWADNLKKLGKWHNRGSYVPKTGDIIIFGTSQTWRTHVGIVIGVKDGVVYTSEGNATGQPYYASRVTEKSYSLNSSYIVGYGSVNY